jgi:hypothetical protein
MCKSLGRRTGVIFIEPHSFHTEGQESRRDVAKHGNSKEGPGKPRNLERSLRTQDVCQNPVLHTGLDALDHLRGPFPFLLDSSQIADLQPSGLEWGGQKVL